VASPAWPKLVGQMVQKLMKLWLQLRLRWSNN
jgi:hypothetical protein